MGLKAVIYKKTGNFTLDVKLEAEEEITSILGESGCGKSMTLKCIAGIEKPDAGHIELDGRVLFDSDEKINLAPQKRGVGYLFQNYALFPNMNVRQNILCGLHREKDRQIKEQKLEEMLDFFSLRGLEYHKPSQLSGGQQQRCALARILVSDPGLLMLDEPFSALDAHLRDSLKVELRDLLRSVGKPVLMVTHSRDEAYNMSEKLGIMHEGRMLALKPVKEVFADPGSVPAAVITGCKNIVSAIKTGPCEAEVPDWGIRLITKQELRDDLVAIGIRAHYFRAADLNGERKNSRQGRNRGGAQYELPAYPVVFAEEMEEPFETILQFRFANQKPGTPNVWWRIPKDRKLPHFPKAIRIAPVNVLPLYEPYL